MTNRTKEAAQEHLSNPMIYGVTASFTIVIYSFDRVNIVVFYQITKKINKQAKSRNYLLAGNGGGLTIVNLTAINKY